MTVTTTCLYLVFFILLTPLISLNHVFLLISYIILEQIMYLFWIIFFHSAIHLFQIFTGQFQSETSLLIDSSKPSFHILYFRNMGWTYLVFKIDLLQSHIFMFTIYSLCNAIRGRINNFFISIFTTYVKNINILNLGILLFRHCLLLYVDDMLTACLHGEWLFIVWLKLL